MPNSLHCNEFHRYRGQLHARTCKQYNRQLRNLIHRDKLAPGIIVSHEMNLDDAAEGYQNFDYRLDGWTKVLLHP